MGDQRSFIVPPVGTGGELIPAVECPFPEKPGGERSYSAVPSRGDVMLRGLAYQLADFADIVTSAADKSSSSRASCPRRSSRAGGLRRAPCRAGRWATCGRRPIRARRRCDGRSARSARPCPPSVHSQHLQIAVGIAERHDRPAADELLDADRLARPCRR